MFKLSRYQRAWKRNTARQSTFSEVSEAYLVWVKENRTERFYKRQERILRQDVLPALGDLSVEKVLHDLPGSILVLPPQQQKQGLAAHKTVRAVIGWRLKHLY